MKSGIIMEINERFLTVLTPEGEFLRASKPKYPYEIGQEINFYPIEIKEKKNLFQFYKGKALIAAAMVLIISIGSLIPFYENNKVYAYMSIDINPSVEIGINEKMQVVELLSYNKDGSKIIEEITDWKKKDVQQVADQVLDEIDKQGYTKNNKDIVIATVYNGEREKKVDQKLKKEIEQIKDEVKEKKMDLTVVEATKEDRKKAKKQGVSPGSYKEKMSNKGRAKSKQRNQTNQVKNQKKQNAFKKNKSEKHKKVSNGLYKNQRPNKKQLKEKNGFNQNEKHKGNDKKTFQKKASKKQGKSNSLKVSQRKELQKSEQEWHKKKKSKKKSKKQNQKQNQKQKKPHVENRFHN